MADKLVNITAAEKKERKDVAVVSLQVLAITGVVQSLNSPFPVLCWVMIEKCARWKKLRERPGIECLRPPYWKYWKQ